MRSQVNINPAYQPSELKYCLNKVGVKAIVSSESFKTQDYYKMMAEIMPELPSGERIILKCYDENRSLNSTLSPLWGVHSVAMFCFASFRKFQLPIGPHSSCSISPMAGGICQKYSTIYQD